MKWWTPVLNSAPSQSGKEDDFPERSRRPFEICNLRLQGAGCYVAEPIPPYAVPVATRRD